MDDLQIEFYSHLKRWLAKKVKTIQLSDLKAVNSFIDGFESDMAKLETAISDNDEYDIDFFSGICKRRHEACENCFAINSDDVTGVCLRTCDVPSRVLFSFLVTHSTCVCPDKLWWEIGVARSSSDDSLINQVVQLYKCIKTKLPDDGQMENNANEHENMNADQLKIAFFSHLKHWLSTRSQTIQQSDVSKMNEYMSEFDSELADLESVENGNDEDDIKFYTGYCARSLNIMRETLTL